MITDSSPKVNKRARARRSKRQLSNISGDDEDSGHKLNAKKARKSVYKSTNKIKLK